MAELDLDAFAEQLTNFRVPSDEARIAVRHIDDAMKASILALYRSAVHVGAEWYPALANVTAPALVMWGIEDGYFHTISPTHRAKPPMRALW